MTDIAKALAFARECLKWEDACVSTPHGLYITGLKVRRDFSLNDMSALQGIIDEFLSKRYLIQINRGTSTLFKWTVIVGLQDKSVRGAHLGDARADSDDLFDAVFDACVTAARADK